MCACVGGARAAGRGSSSRCGGARCGWGRRELRCAADLSKLIVPARLDRWPAGRPRSAWAGRTPSHVLRLVCCVQGGVACIHQRHFGRQAMLRDASCRTCAPPIRPERVDRASVSPSDVGYRQRHGPWQRTKELPLFVCCLPVFSRGWSVG
jgi:hypothetical protein